VSATAELSKYLLSALIYLVQAGKFRFGSSVMSHHVVL
jgi:hypothetical protein